MKIFAIRTAFALLFMAALLAVVGSQQPQQQVENDDVKVWRSVIVPNTSLATIIPASWSP